MQKIKPMKPAIKILSILVLFAFFTSACKHITDNQNRYEILKEVLNAYQENNIFLDSTATDLDFQVPIDIKYLDDLFYGKKFNTDIDSIVTTSDIKYWNEAIDHFKPGKIHLSNYDDIPFYSVEKQKIFNTQDEITDFDYFLKVSEPFMNKLSDKALIYVESYAGPNSAMANTYLMILEKQQHKTWKVVYKGALRVTSI